MKEFLGETYDYLEAENGNQAVQIMEENPGIDLMLLDINMPQMDGFEVLKWMKLSQCIEETPVIMISSEESVETMRKAYEMGITDYITRPFDSVIIKKRVQNTLELYANQKRLINVVVDQVYEKEENNNIMLRILSNVLGSRNSESSEHMDIMMPVMDGLTATKAIRALNRPDAGIIPIIAMTANAFAEDVQRCLDAGMNAHLAKPLDIEKVKKNDL